MSTQQPLEEPEQLIGWLNSEGSWEGTEGHTGLPTKTSESNRKISS